MDGGSGCQSALDVDWLGVTVVVVVLAVVLELRRRGAMLEYE